MDIPLELYYIYNEHNAIRDLKAYIKVCEYIKKYGKRYLKYLKVIENEVMKYIEKHQYFSAPIIVIFHYITTIYL